MSTITSSNWFDDLLREQPDNLPYLQKVLRCDYFACMMFRNKLNRLEVEDTKRFFHLMDILYCQYTAADTRQVLAQELERTSIKWNGTEKRLSVVLPFAHLSPWTYYDNKDALLSTVIQYLDTVRPKVRSLAVQHLGIEPGNLPISETTPF